MSIKTRLTAALALAVGVTVTTENKLDTLPGGKIDLYKKFGIESDLGAPSVERQSLRMRSIPDLKPGERRGNHYSI